LNHLAVGVALLTVLTKRWVHPSRAQVDFSARVEESFLDGLITDAVCTDLENGGRCCVDAEQRGAVLTALEGNSYKLSAGGSLSNTLVALSRLVEQHSKWTREHAAAGVVVTDQQQGEESAAPVNVSIACSLGPDPLGDFYRTKVKHYGVHVLSEPGDGGTTGSVIVLTTPDAQRTMLSCWGTSASLPYDQTLDDAVAASDVLVIEGYLWEMPETIRSIKRALRTAKANGVTVAFTASDRTCVERHGDEFWQLLRSGDVDVLFCNREEALAMTGAAPDGLVAGAASETVDALAKHASTVIVTDGSQGAYLRRGDERVHVPPHWLDSPPVDTCGAGDAYAAGCLFGMLQGRALPAVGAMGARVASLVIAQAGARLSERDARMLMQDPLFVDPAHTFSFRGKASPEGLSKFSHPHAVARAEGWGKLRSHLNNLKRDSK
jgi:sugar/nucleoside kinase (ribokinase family)